MDKVETLEDLYDLVRQKKAVISKLLHRPYPAAWIINHSGGRILQLIRAGLYRYEKGEQDASDQKGSEETTNQEKNKKTGGA